jgi:hypothetical protein
MHEGAYVAGNIKYARGFVGIFAVGCNQCLFPVAYRLVPENPSQQLLWMAAYCYSNDIAVIGESARGGLVFLLCLLLKQKEMITRGFKALVVCGDQQPTRKNYCGLPFVASLRFLKESDRMKANPLNIVMGVIRGAVY